MGRILRLTPGKNRGEAFLFLPEHTRGGYQPPTEKEEIIMSEENLYTFENETYRKTYWHTCSQDRKSVV